MPDCINYYFTSNHCDAFFVDDTDRRFFINEIKRHPQPAEWYRAFCDWALRGGPGASYIFYHLLHFDLTDFDPQGHAMFTSSKREVQNSGRTELEDFVRSLQMDMDNVLKLGEAKLPYKLWSAAALLGIATVGGTKPIRNATPGLLGRKLKQGGFPPLNDGDPIWGVGRLFALRDKEAMLALDNDGVRAQYDAERKPKTAKY